MNLFSSIRETVTEKVADLGDVFEQLGGSVLEKITTVIDIPEKIFTPDPPPQPVEQQGGDEVAEVEQNEAELEKQRIEEEKRKKQEEAERKKRQEEEAELRRKKKEKQERLKREREERLRKEAEERKRLEEARLAEEKRKHDEEQAKKAAEEAALVSKLAAAQKAELEKKRIEEEKRRAEEKAQREREEEVRRQQLLEQKRKKEAEQRRKREEEARRKQEAEKKAAEMKAAAEKAKAEDAARLKAEAAAAEAAAAAAATAARPSTAASYNAVATSATEWKSLVSRDPEDDEDTEDKALNRNATQPQEAKPTIDGTMKCLFKSGTNIFEVQSGNLYAFFNATTDYDFFATYTYSKHSTITPKKDTTMTVLPDGRFKCEICVHPGETKEFISGKPNGWSSSFRASGVSAEYQKQLAAEQEKLVEKEMAVLKGASSANVDRAATIWAPAGDGQLLERCVSRGELFVDPQFKPQQPSIARPGVDSQMETKPWKRPQGYLQEGVKPRLFIGSIEPNDIQQGALGDCYYVCSVSALAEFPGLVRDLFRHPVPFGEGRALRRKEQEVGAYRVWLNKHGWWHSLILDSYLPAVGAPIFASNSSEPNEMWVALLEKAYAKMHGSYASIASGDAMSALEDLTGFPSTHFSDEEWKSGEAFNLMLKADQMGCLISLGTPGRDDSEYMGKSGAKNPDDFKARYKNAGLGMGHAYSALRVEHFKSKNLKLIQIRNPWGNSTEWTGDWGDKSAKWKQHPDVARQCDFTTAEDDGTFWMEWSDVQSYFDHGGICYVKSGWSDYRVAGKFTSGKTSVALEVTVKQPTQVMLTCSQMDRRGLPSNHANKKYESLLLSIATCDSASKANSTKFSLESHSHNKGMEASNSACYMSARSIATSYTFHPGTTYLVVPRVHNESATKEFTLGFLSEREVDGSNLAVQFRQIPSSSQIWQHYKKFDCAGITAVSSKYQAKVPKCAPVSDQCKEIRPRWLLQSDSSN